MAPIFFSYSNDKFRLGFVDARYCPSCNRMEIHEGIKHHVHFIVGIPFYWSNKFYSYCINCGHTVLLKGEDKKYIKKLNRNAVKFFKKVVQLTDFVTDITNICSENEVVSDGVVDEDRLHKVVGLVKEKYDVIHKNRYEYRFYLGMTKACAESILRIGDDNKD